MLKKSRFSPARPQRAETRFSPCVVLASLPGAVKRETRVSLGAAALPRNGASLGEEAVLADSGLAGEEPAVVGRVRRLAFLSILLEATSVVLARADH